MERRTLLKLVTAGVLPATNGLVQLACTQGGYEPEFFSRGELEALDSLTEAILPSDEHSAGARAARVARYIDVMVADAAEPVRESFRAGLLAVAELAKECYDRDFAACDATQQDAIMARMASNEEHPASETERFFAVLKRATIEGYYTSQVGIHDDLGYTGNTAIDEFPGCTHGSHSQGAAG